MNKKDSRLGRIIRLMQEHGGSISVHDLSEILHVSDMTVRRDLNELQSHHLIERYHGRAVLTKEHLIGNFQNIENEYALPAESEKNSDEKTRIGQFAASLIQKGDIISIDSGSTTDLMANYIPEAYPLTVVCYNLNIVQKLWKYPNINILLAGGLLHHRDMMFDSPEGIDFLRTVRANKAFVSASGVHKKLGLTCALAYEVSPKQALLQSSAQKILLADSSKFGTVKTVYFAGLSEIDMIVTDNGISQEWKEMIQNLNIELCIV